MIERALVEGLVAGETGAVAPDVHEIEPLVLDNKLLDLGFKLGNHNASNTTVTILRTITL